MWRADIGEDDQWEASRETARHVNRATHALCLPLVLTEDEYRELPLQSPRLAEALSRDGIDLMAYSK